MIELTPAISSYLTLLLGRLELYRKTDIPELDLKQRNSLHSIRSKVKALLDGEVTLASACPLTDALMRLWIERQRGVGAEMCQISMNEQGIEEGEEEEIEGLDDTLHNAEEKAFHKILNDQSTIEKLKDVRQLFALVNEICSTLKEQQTEVRKLKGLGRQCINENTLMANLRQCTSEELATPSVAGRVWVDGVITQLRSDHDVPVSPLLDNSSTAADPSGHRIGASAQLATPGGAGGDSDLIPAPNIYENVVSFESAVVVHEIPKITGVDNQSQTKSEELVGGQTTRRFEDDLFAEPSILRPTGRRPRVKFNTRKELQENALLGLCCDEPISPAPQQGQNIQPRVAAKPKTDVMGRRRMSISSRFQTNMDEISDELRGLNEWKN